MAIATDKTTVRRDRGMEIALHEVSKSFSTGRERVRALDKVDLVVEKGEFVSIIGPSGCGKSTLLRIIGGLIDPDAGHAQVGGEPSTVARTSGQFGFVPQTPALLNWKTVQKNVEVLSQLRHRRSPVSSSPSDARELLNLVGLLDFAEAFPQQLSGGMQQRVSLARAFRLGAPVLLMDEPFAGLDEITRSNMRYLLLDLWRRSGSTVVLVTHSIGEAVALSDRVVVLGRGPGSIHATARIGLQRPRSEAVEDEPEFHRHVSQIRSLIREAQSL